MYFYFLTNNIKPVSIGVYCYLYIQERLKVYQFITSLFATQGAVTLSLQYSKSPKGIQRKKSLVEKGVFGVDIGTVSR